MSIATGPRWSMARTKRGSSATATNSRSERSSGRGPESPSASGRAATPSQGRFATSRRGVLLHPAVEQLHLFGWPWSITRHRPGMQLRRDRRGVGDDIVVLPEVERPTHGITILLAKHRPYVGRERDRTRRRGTIGRWGTHWSPPAGLRIVSPKVPAHNCLCLHTS